MLTKLMQILRGERGGALSEYGLLIALIAVVCIAALIALGNSIADKFWEVTDEIENASPRGN